jgi:hypothetical protein
MATITITPGTTDWSSVSDFSNNVHQQVAGSTANEELLPDNDDGWTVEGLGNAVIDGQSTRDTCITIDEAENVTIRNIRLTGALKQCLFVLNKSAGGTDYKNIRVENVVADNAKGTVQGDGNFELGGAQNIQCGPVTFSGCLAHNAERMGFDTQDLYPSAIVWSHCVSHTNGKTAAGGGFFSHPWRKSDTATTAVWTAHGTGTAGTFVRDQISSDDVHSSFFDRTNNDVLTEGGSEDTLNAGEWFSLSGQIYVNIDGATDPDTLNTTHGRCPVPTDAFVWRDCTAYSNESSDNGHGSGIQMDDATQNSTAYRCVAYSNEGTGIKIFLGLDNTLESCVAYANGTNATQSNNQRIGYASSTATGTTLNQCLADDHPEHGAQLANGSSTVNNSIFTNNLEYGLRNVNSVTTLNNCAFFGNGLGTTDPAGTGPFTVNNSVTTDPLFLDQTGRDYRLDAGSPCIGAGTEWWSGSTNQPQGEDGLRFPLRAGGGPDIGPYPVRPGDDGATRQAGVYAASVLQAGVDIAKGRSA